MMDVGKKKLHELKKSFRELDKTKRAGLSQAMHKINLGVQNEGDLNLVKKFLGTFPVELKKHKLENLMAFLHADDEAKPEEYLSQDSLTEISVSISTKDSLPEYNEDDVDTLKDDIQPFPKDSENNS